MSLLFGLRPRENGDVSKVFLELLIVQLRPPSNDVTRDEIRF